MTDARVWRVAIPAPVDADGRPVWLNTNDRRSRYAQARAVKAWRELAVVYAKKARLPKGLPKVRILGVFGFDTARDRDEHNYVPTLKAIVDGLARDKTHIGRTGRVVHAPGYGLIHDDTPEYLDGPYPRFARGVYPGQAGVVVVITEVPR